MVVEELLIKLGYIGDTTGAKAFQSKFESFKGVLVDTLEKVEAAGLAISAFFAHHLEGIDQQAKFAKQVDISVEKLQELQYAANISGSSTQDLNASIKSLTTSIFEASEGVGGAVEVFGRLGIATTSGGRIRSTIDIFKELADKLKSLPASEQIDFSKRVGISESTILLLQQGSRGIQKLMSDAQQLGVYSEEDARKAEEYADAWRALTQIFKVLRDQIAIGLAPVFTAVVKELTEWLRLNKQMIVQDISIFIRGVISVLGVLAKLIDLVVSGFNELISILGGFEGVLTLLASSAGLAVLFSLPKIISTISATFRTAAIAAAAFDAAAFWPVALGVAAVSLLVAVLQDVVVWFLHGESAIGHLLGPIDDFKRSVEDLYKTVAQGVTHGFTAVSEFLHGLVDDIERRIRAISDFFNNLYAKTKHVLHIKTEAEQNNAAMSNQIPLTNGMQISNLTNNNQMGDTKNSPVTNNNFTITVNGADSDNAEAIKQAIYQAARQAQRNNSSPVLI